MRPDIAFFIPSMNGGGAEKMMLALANHYALAGKTVDLVLVNKEGQYLQHVSSLVRVVDLKSHRTLASLPRLVRYLKEEKPMTMLSALTHANIAAVLARKLSGEDFRLVVSQRSLVARQRNIKRFVYNKVVGWFYNSSDGVVAISEGVKEDMVEALSVRRELIHTIYNPAYSEVNVERSREEAGHPYFNSENKCPVVLAVGRLVEVKGFDSLIRAFSLVRKNTDVRLIILGEGPLRKKLQGLIDSLDLNEVVSMPGFVENPYSYMKNADLFVLASLSEGFGNVLVEAMACGTPVVSTNCPTGPAEILEGGKWGRLVPVNNSEKLANAIFDSLQEKNRPRVEVRAKDFAIGPIAEAYLSVLR